MEQSKRGRLSQEQWQEHIEQQQKSALSIGAYCQEHKLTPSNFYAWRKRLSVCDLPKSGKFIQLKPKDIAAQAIRIITPEGYRLEIDSGTELAYIRSILTLLST